VGVAGLPTKEHRLILPLVLAAAIAPAPASEAARRALLAIVARTAASTACDSATVRKVVRNATMSTIGRIGGDEVVIAEVQDPCMCGAQNCPEYVVRTGTHPRLLLEDVGLEMKPLRDRTAALPKIVTTAHDSAAVYVETTYAWRKGTYVRLRSMNVRADTK
jgi:hypothetical protein